MTRLKALWNLLFCPYFVVFTFKNPNDGVAVNAQWKSEHKSNELINDVIESIYKQEFYRP